MSDEPNWQRIAQDVTRAHDAARAELDGLRARIAVIRDDGYRVGCDCGHAVFCHVDDAGCIGGLSLCKCRRGWWSILRDRLDTALANQPSEATS